MSRSYERPTCRWVGGNNKLARSFANRCLRHHNRIKLEREAEDFNPKLLREVSNVWCFPTDGLAHPSPEYSVTGIYLDLEANVKKALNGGTSFYTWRRVGWSDPEGLVEYFGLPDEVESLEKINNSQMMEYARFCYNRAKTR
jgi:hypothetical protein